MVGVVDGVGGVEVAAEGEVGAQGAGLDGGQVQVGVGGAAQGFGVGVDPDDGVAVQAQVSDLGPRTGAPGEAQLRVHGPPRPASDQFDAGSVPGIAGHPRRTKHLGARADPSRPAAGERTSADTRRGRRTPRPPRRHRPHRRSGRSARGCVRSPAASCAARTDRSTKSTAGHEVSRRDSTPMTGPDTQHAARPPHSPLARRLSLPPEHQLSRTPLHTVPVREVR